MSDNTKTFLAIVVFCALVGSFLIGGCVCNEFYRGETVKHHAAEYYLDANNERQWRWLDEAKK